MIVLALETATIEVGVALVGPDGLVASARARTGRRHVERLHVAIVEVLAAASVAPGDLGGLGVDVGPGLFTGLRVGLAAAKGLGLALGLRVAGLTSTTVLGQATRRAGARGVVVPVLDVRRGEVAWALPAGAGFGAPRLGEPEELARVLATLGPELLLVGDGARRYEARLRSALPQCTLELAGDEFEAPPVETLGALARSELEAGRSLEPAALAALYLRGADAEPGSWTARQAVVQRARAVAGEG